MTSSVQRIFTALLIAGALCLTVLWPGDVSWGSDEPRLLAAAWHANHDGELVRGGLWGNFGIRYGPLPTWIYQALLLLTHDPVTLVAIRAFLCAGATAAALLWLARELRLPSWFAAAILVAPYVVEYHRLLWDASFAMPLSALTLAAFASFLRTGAGWTLGLSVTGAFLLPTIHPQALPFTVSLVGWLCWRHRAALRLHWKLLTAMSLVFLITHGAWIIEAAYGFMHNLSGSVAHGYPHGAGRASCALAPLLGGNLIGGPQIVHQIASAPALLRLGLIGLTLVYPLVWFGIIQAVRGWRAAAGPRDIVAAVAVATLGGQALLFGVLRIPSEPQYFFGTFALHVFLAWFAVDELRAFKLGAIFGAGFGASAALATLSFAIVVHRSGYDPALSWPKLASQAALARELNAFADTRAATDVRLFQQYPQSLRALRLLLPPKARQSQKNSGGLFITRPETGHAELVVQERATAVLADGIDITPLPKGWQPETW